MFELKYLKKFGSETEYNSYISGDEVFLPNVSLIGTGTADVRYTQVPIPIAEAGMICYADSSNNLKFINYQNWNSSLGTAQGVVIVPSNHTSDGTARIMCIDGVNTDGSHIALYDFKMAWSNTSVERSLPNMDKVPTWSNTIGGTIGVATNGYLPSDSSGFTGETCATDSFAKYSNNSSTPYIPSPYLEDGSQNPDYINTVEATTGNCLSDFDGKSNTAVLVGLGSDYVAANACNLYGTTALPAGNWYLPACGELGYIIPRFNEINAALVKVRGVQLGVNLFYWSSTEYDSGKARCLYTYYGLVTASSKDYPNSVRAFASIPVSRISF